MKLIEKYVEKIVAKVEEDLSTLGVKDQIVPKSYLTNKDQIFSLYRLFCLLDSKFEDDLNIKLFYNIISSISFYNRNSINPKKAYNQLENSSNYESEEYKTFQEKFASLVKKHDKLELITKLLDTKLFYFDKLMCAKANESTIILEHLNRFRIDTLKSTQHYISKRKIEFSTKIEATYLLDKENIDPKFTQKDLEYLLTLDTKAVVHKKIDEDLDKLIEVKDKIKLFKDLTSSDIKNIIKNYNFMTFKRNEVIIQQGQSGNAIFFILTGECVVKVDGREVSKIGRNHVIGEFAFIQNEKRSATVISVGTTFVLKVELDIDRYEYFPTSLVKLYKNITQELIKKINILNRVKRMYE